jgi:hypothetical protein
MWKGRQLAARLKAIAELEAWAAQYERGQAPPLCVTRRLRRGLGRDCATLAVAQRACQQQRRPLAPVVKCLAHVLRERCRGAGSP